MKINKLYISLTTIAFLTGGAFLFSPKHTVNANLAGNNIVISQIQTATSGSGNADQEFVELYNPTNAVVDLAGWRLTRKSSGGTQTTLVSNIAGTIAAHGYFLIAHPSYSNPTTTPDLTYSASSSAMASNNTVVLYSDAGQTVVDKVGFGTVTLADFETQQFGTNPAADESIIRKATQGSTPASVGNGGAEALAGNGYDTDNNSTDFVLLASAFPHNSSSPTGTIPTGTTGNPTVTINPSSTTTPIPTVIPTSVPTGSPTSIPSPTATHTPTPTQQPTSIPTATPTITMPPTSVPTQTPTPTKTPTPTSTNNPTPTTISPTATKTPTPTNIPTITNTPTPVTEATPTPKNPSPSITKAPHHKPHGHDFPLPHFHLKHKNINVFGKHISLPYIHCSFGRK